MRPSPLTLAALAAAIIASVISRHSSDEAPSAYKGTAETSLSSAQPLEAILNASTHASADTAAGRELRRAALLLRRQPNHSDHWLRLGDALLNESRSSQDFSQYASIELVYLEARRLDPQNAGALAGLAWAAGACHRFDDSVAWATLALAQNPDLPAAHGILGDAAVELGRYAEAESHYQRMLDLKPDSSSYSRAAHMMYLKGNTNGGLHLMRRALRAAGTNTEPAAWCAAALSQMLCQQGAAPSALQISKEQLMHSPDNPLLLTALGRAHALLGDFTAAISAYERAVARVPQHTALAALYDLYLASGRTSDAARAFTAIEQLHQMLRAKKIQGGDGQLARFYADAGQKLPFALALASAEYEHHKTAAAADTLAWAAFRSGRTQDAARLLPEMLRENVSDSSIYYHAGLIAEANGQPADAARYLHAALAHSSRFNPVHAPLAESALQRVGGAGPSP